MGAENALDGGGPDFGWHLKATLGELYKTRRLVFPLTERVLARSWSDFVNRDVGGKTHWSHKKR